VPWRRRCWAGFGPSLDTLAGDGGVDASWFRPRTSAWKPSLGNQATCGGIQRLATKEDVTSINRLLSGTRLCGPDGRVACQPQERMGW